MTLPAGALPLQGRNVGFDCTQGDAPGLSKAVRFALGYSPVAPSGLWE